MHRTVSNISYFTLLSIGAMSAIVFQSGCTSSSSEDAKAFEKQGANTIVANDLKQLKFTTIEKKPFPISMDIPGRVTIPDRDLYVFSSRVQGRLDDVLVTVGDTVKEGQVIASIWSPDLATAAEELMIAEKENDTELVELTRQKIKAIGLDAKDIVQGRSNFSIRAPISGVVIDRKLNAGTSLQIGDQILTIGKLGSLQFQGDVTPEKAIRIRVGMKVLFSDSPELHGVVEAVSPVPDPVTRLIRVRCKLLKGFPKNTPQEAYLKAQVVLEEKPAVTIPSKSLVFHQGSDYAFIKTGDKPVKIERVEIKVTGRTADFLSVAEDNPLLVAGGEVISDGALLLNEVLSSDEEE